MPLHGLTTLMGVWITDLTGRLTTIDRRGTEVFRAELRPTAPLNPRVKIAVRLSAYQFISTFLVMRPISISNPFLLLPISLHTPRLSG
jgi:hypothetical protein